MRSFSQSGSSSASSDVSTRKAVGRGFFSGNQMSSRAWNSSSPAAGEQQGQQQTQLNPRSRPRAPRPGRGAGLPRLIRESLGSGGTQRAN